MTSVFRDIRMSLPRAAWWTTGVALSAVFLYPIWVMLSQSFKNPAEAAASPPTLYPHSLSLANYQGLNSVSGLSLFHNLLNSVQVSLGATLATVILSTLGGYAFARAKFPGSSVLFFATLATFMIPFQAIITPLFAVLRSLNLINSLIGLGIVYVTFNLPFGLFIMRNSFAAIPAAIEEAALIDGCGIFKALRFVLIPIAVPGVITTALLTFFATWNEFFAALILISDQSKFTLPVTLSLVSTGVFGSVNWGLLQAGVALTIIPCLVIYVLLQRYYVSGMLSGALK